MAYYILYYSSTILNIMHPLPTIPFIFDHSYLFQKHSRNIKGVNIKMLIFAKKLRNNVRNFPILSYYSKNNHKGGRKYKYESDGILNRMSKQNTFTPLHFIYFITYF